MQSLIKNQLTESQDVLSRFLKSESELQKIEKAGHLITAALVDGGKVISCGNGGSHCDAMHFAEEMTGRYRDNRAPMAAICISDPAHITCVGNDYGFEYVFSRYVEALGKDGDVLLALSTSGNSGNILKAIKAAKSQNMGTVLLTGETGGAMHGLADVEINIPHTGYADRIQEMHIKIIHILILLVETQIQASD